MVKKIVYTLLFILSSMFTSNANADFDERYWEWYAELQIPSDGQLPTFGSVYLEPGFLENSKFRFPFSDIRIITSNNLEVPYQITTRSPEKKVEELSVRILNLSYTKKKETYFEGVLEKAPVVYNMVEIITDEKNFYRQVQLFGSMDGKIWNLIRSDTVIFDYSREEYLKHTKIFFNDSSYKYLGIKIINNNEKPLKISGFKVYHQKIDPGIEAVVNSWISKKEENSKNKESILIVNLSSFFPASKIRLNTSDKNFQRKINVLVKRDTEWIMWADDIIFNFDTEKIKESKLDINIPEVSTKEMKLIIKNYDSPPINILRINVFAFKKILAFKLGEKGKYFLFWGNDQSKPPHYDISQLMAKHDIRDIKIFSIGIPKMNPNFVGHEKRLPLTERYKYLIYGVIILVIALLILLQYKVIKKTENQ